MKKLLILMLAALLLLSASAAAEGGYGPRLSGLTHNCTNTGVMLPASFSPDTDTYLLTVASWVNNVSLTPACDDPYATITVNGVSVRSGQASGYFSMSDKPQLVTIRVTNYQGVSRDYRVFLQRRPSERRTRTSYGFVNEVYSRSGSWYIDADLVTVNWNKSGLSSYTNKAKERYRYAVDSHCALYTGSMEYPQMESGAEAFRSHYDGNMLYRFIYIEDKIVAVIPFRTDY